MIKQVICISWGTKYGPVFINRLYGMVARNITPPFRFTCFTDSTAGVRPEVDCQPLPPIPIEVPKTRKGMWPKSRLWGPKLADLSGPVLFLDLDLVVVGSLDDLFTYGDPNRVILSRNPARPFERIGQTSVFRFPVGALQPIQAEFCADPVRIAETYVYEQRFVTRRAPGGIDLFPRRWVRHFRRQSVRPFPLNYFRPPQKGRDTRIVIFPGAYLPEDAIAGGWAGRPFPSRRAHLLGINQLRGENEGLFEYLRHYAMPADWVADAWRD